MSKISTAHDAVLTALASLFPNKLRIPNPYNIEDNPSQFLRDSYGMRVANEAPSDSEFCTFSRTRVFAITLSREVLSNYTQTDAMDTAVKALLEDVYTLQKDFMNPDQLNQEASIEKIDMAGTTPVLTFIGEHSNFIAIEVLFQLQITDNI